MTAFPLNAKIPEGPLQDKWKNCKFNLKLVNPTNRKKYSIIVVGTGLAGASAAASLAEMGYDIKAFCFQDSPRRAHSIAAQGGINASKNYKNDGDSIYRLFYDTIKGGDYRAREANVYRLAETSNEIIDQCVAQGVPFAREYGGMLDNRSFGGVQVSRTFYARGQTGQQLLLGAYGALNRQIAKGKIKMYSRTEMLDLIVINGQAKGIITRNLISGKIESHSAHAVILATGGYGNVFYLSTNAMGCNATAIWRAHKKGAFLGNPCFTQIHPTCIPVSGDHQSKLTLMSESLRNDGRVWVPKSQELAKKLREGLIKVDEISQEDKDYFLERKYPSFGNLVPRDVASRNAKMMVDQGKGVGKTGVAVYLDFKDAIDHVGKEKIEEKYGNLFDMYKQITDENPYKNPMRIYPAVHYTMGGLWVDYHLMTSIPGLFALGEANFSDHGANRLGASALMQGLSDGYFIIPYTIGDYLSNIDKQLPDASTSPFKEAEDSLKEHFETLKGNKGSKTATEIHKKLGKIMWEYCGMSRSNEGIKKGLEAIKLLKKEFLKEIKIVSDTSKINLSLEQAGRVEDFIELGELMLLDALDRNESCGGHFREEYQTENNEAERDDENYSYVAAWEYKKNESVLHKEPLDFQAVKPAKRSYV